MRHPTVSFVVPCYNLAHLLKQCVDSILWQTYGDFELLIMDDCSPDNTGHIATSFHDKRVRHVRNAHNLGHLRNYNKGIRLSSGKYVWLISADDYLRRPYVLERYVNLLNANPTVGYTFCPGVGVKSDHETGVLDYSVYDKHDRIISGRVLLRRLLHYNLVVAASALVRRDCYNTLGMFPLDGGMAWSGDWYLWCLFALLFDVGYFAEPMVCYREHDLSMTNILTTEHNNRDCSVGDIAVPWMIRQKAEEHGLRGITKICLRAVADEYARQVTSKQYRLSTVCISVDEAEQSLCEHIDNENERKWIRARMFAGIGDRLRAQGKRASARHYYLAALRNAPQLTEVYAKLVLLSCGTLGDRVHNLAHAARSLRPKVY